MSISAYLSFVKDLGLTDLKSELRHLIIDKTSHKVEHPPKIRFDKLKLAEAHDGNGQQKEEKEKSE